MANETLLQELQAHLSDELLPELVSNGAFGKDVCISEQVIKPVGGFEVDHWMSHTFRTTLRVQELDGGSPRTLSLFTKYQVPESTWCDTAVAFRNEEVMYSQVVPFFESLWAEGSSKEEPLDLFPKCYGIKSGARSVVVSEDLTADGYRLASSTSALDGAHVFLALRQLGRLHALSYSAKVRRRGDFMSLASELGEGQYVEASRQYQGAYLGTVADRGVSRLAARGDLDAATVEHLRRRLAWGREASPVFDVMANARSPEEPLAVIVHGDFCRNNMMFKYDDRGQPVDVKFFDLQASRYCSPAVDLSFFLFLNTTPTQRSVHWDDFFVAYYDGLTATMRSLLSTGHDPTMSPTMDMPSLASIRADFAKHAMYGYIICSYFLPVMQHATSPTEQDCRRVNQEQPDKFEAGCSVGKLLAAVGGDAGDDSVADLLIEFVDRGLVGL